MRETGPVRFSFGDGSVQALHAGALYVPIARTLLGISKNIMRLGGLPSTASQRLLPDGTLIRWQSIHGLDQVQIFPPGFTPADAPQVVEVQAVEVLEQQAPLEDIEGPAKWYIAGYRVVDGDIAPTLWTSRETVHLPLEGYARGQAVRFVPDAFGVPIAIMGYVDNGSFNEVVWWTFGSLGWTLHTTGFAGYSAQVRGFFSGGTSVYWDFDNSRPAQISAPTVTPRTATPHKVRVAYQRSRDFVSFDADGVHDHRQSVLAALEIDDGTGNLYTIGRWGGDPISPFPDATFGRSLEDWVAFALANTDRREDYGDVGWGDVVEDGEGPYVYADIFGPFDVSESLIGTTYTFGDGGELTIESGSYVTLDISPGFTVSPSTNVQVWIRVPDYSSIDFNSVSLDGKWCAGFQREGYVPFVRFAGNLGALDFVNITRSVRRPTAGGVVEYLDLPTDMERPEAASPYVGTSGAVVNGVFDRATTDGYVAVRNTPLLSLIRGPVSWVNEISPAGTAVAGGGGIGDVDLPWVWLEGVGATNLPLPQGFPAGEGWAPTDDGRAAVGYAYNDSDEVSLLWLRERTFGVLGPWHIALQLDESEVWFNDVAIRASPQPG